ncbi:DUF4271 domain-containing protein [Pedobacter glucosidilyticus]|uniref:DUF4271 domain-containing protein n=1 Tax=Pedobacter glucosidilyticus TaxID=1122941 RepID=UPI0026F12D26|nr:DUF4271 domain-containing protein [Pedobacter glucosidilyticus]
MLKFSCVFVWCLCLAFTVQGKLSQDSLSKKTDSLKIAQFQNWRLQEALLKAQQAKIRDSITWYYLNPNPKRENLFVQQMLKKYVIADLYTHIFDAKKSKNAIYGVGKTITKLHYWVLFVMLGLLLLFALLKRIFSKETEMVFSAFYDNRILAQINKEENIFTSWFFLFSYLLYSLITGLFLYLFIATQGTGVSLTGFSLFLSVSFYLGLFLGVKILLLRFIGFVFELGKLVREYVHIIYITFFNVAILFIPLTIILILTVYKDSNWILGIAAMLLSIILIAQFSRLVVQILSNYKLSKFYLILYLCAFEICPVLIVIKALNI